MSDTYKSMRDFLRDERAAEVTELGIVLGLVVAGSLATLALIGPKIKKGFDDTNAQIP